MMTEEDVLECKRFEQIETHLIKLNQLKCHGKSFVFAPETIKPMFFILMKALNIIFCEKQDELRKSGLYSEISQLI